MEPKRVDTPFAHDRLGHLAAHQPASRAELVLVTGEKLLLQNGLMALRIILLQKFAE